MDLNLTGRRALVTGASSGIGVGIAQVLAREGATLAITARRRDRLEQLADDIESAGSARPAIIVADLAEADGQHAVLQEATQALGAVDILINNAGGSRPADQLVPPEDYWTEAFALNFTSLRRLAEGVLPGMCERGWGRIVNLSGSMEPRSLNAAAAAKAAVHLWGKGLSCDVAAKGVTVNTIAPGRIRSEQILNKLHPTEQARRTFIERNIPIGRFGEPEDIGHMAAFLCSPLAAYITGAVIPIDGGMHFFAH